MKEAHYLLLPLILLLLISPFISDPLLIPASFGILGWAMLLFVTALPRIAQWSRASILIKLSAQRMWVGIHSFLYVLFHLIFVLNNIFSWNIDAFLTAVSNNLAYYSTATLAFLILLLMTITSNRFSMLLLKKWWKRLHNLVYLALLLIAIHVFGLGLVYANILVWLLFAIATLYLILNKIKRMKR